ncbi:MAG: peptidoglycan editing factor PgeF [Bryobacterales bacterium]|nr:peptidoglycan editing factor PgeF [Bryobacterales bacterium]
MFYLDDRNIYRISEFDQFQWLVHGFGTAHSTGWPPEPFVSVKLIHSTLVLRVEDNCSGRLGQADAVLSNHRGCTVGIRTADCVPILLVDPEHEAVGAVHAGWRGTVSDVAGAAISAMRDDFGTSARCLWAAIGPAIGGCCFEVGPEVAVQFRTVFPERNDLEHRTKVDLTEANRRRLLAAGVSADRILAERLCTFCTPEKRFHSWRRDHSPGRMISAVGIR